MRKKKQCIVCRGQIPLDKPSSCCQECKEMMHDLAAAHKSEYGCKTEERDSAERWDKMRRRGKSIPC